MATIATHNGSVAHREHNVRNKKVVSKEAHIQNNGKYEIWKDETVRQAYHKLFDEALKEYNEKQSREDRCIKDYYSHINKDAKKHTVYEMIVGIYPADNEMIDEEKQKAILKDFVDEWEKRNPNLYMCGAYYHADEQGEPHVHIDYIPIAHGYTKGMKTQNGLVKALKEQGFEKQGKLTAQILWEKRENERLEALCEKRGIKITHPNVEKRKHIDTTLYKAQKGLEKTLDDVKDLLDAQDEIKANLNVLERNRDKAEEQAQKGLERKLKAFSRSWKKEKDSKGFTYNETLLREIKQLVEEREKDVQSITCTDYDKAKYKEDIIALQQDIEEEKKRVKEEYEKARKYKENEKKHIIDVANKIAEKKFKEFKEDISRDIKIKDERLNEYLSGLYINGEPILERFARLEAERMDNKWQDYGDYEFDYDEYDR